MTTYHLLTYLIKRLQILDLVQRLLAAGNPLVGIESLLCHFRFRSLNILHPSSESGPDWEG